MYYPQWDVPVLGGGMVIALIATIHILFAHFAVGAGIYVAVTETMLHRHPQDPDATLLRDFLNRFAKFLILFSFVAGAITGVGIWFAIGLASPRATSILIHNYVWGWAAEWTLFVVEIAAGYAYYTGYHRLAPKIRLRLAWIYAVASWGSLVIINGILTFMLTPGKWLETHAFWDGFFNPTYWPSLVLRTISCLSIAGIFVAIVANIGKTYDREQARRIINHAAWFLAPLVLMLPAAGWYFEAVPEQGRQLIQGGAIAMMLMFGFGVIASTLVGLYAFIGLIWNKRYVNMETAILLGAIAFIATGSMEFVREGIRKPYLIYDFFYSSGWIKPHANDPRKLGEQDLVNANGILSTNPWSIPPGKTAADLTQLELGAAVYDAQCSQCHVVDGVNDIKPLIATWSQELLTANLERIHELKPFMPPLVGTPPEREALRAYLWSLRGPAAPPAVADAGAPAAGSGARVSGLGDEGTGVVARAESPTETGS